MKDGFNRFAVRFLTALLLGLLGLLLHGWAENPVLGVILPRNGCAWELGKLAYWPMLASALLTGRMTGGVKQTLSGASLSLVLTPLALFLAEWAAVSMEATPGLRVALWVAMTAAGTALWEKVRRADAWYFLAAVLGVLYVAFTFLPPAFGPFLDPLDVATMGTIPY